MYANITESPENLNLQLEQFMTEHVYPNEARYHEELAGLEDRFVTMSVVEELKAKAKALKSEITSYSKHTFEDILIQDLVTINF